MDDLSIIECYKKGYSVKYIIKKYYKSKNRELSKRVVNGQFIIDRPKYSYVYCAEYVYDVLINYVQKYDEVNFCLTTAKPKAPKSLL